MAIALTWLTACSVGPKIDPQQQQLAADIYAQLSLGYGKWAASLGAATITKSPSVKPQWCAYP